MNSTDKVNDIEDKPDAESVNNRKITTEAEDEIMAYVNSIVSDDEVMEIRQLMEQTQKHIDELVNTSNTAQTNVQCDAEQLGAKVPQKLEDKSEECVSSSTNTAIEFGDDKQTTVMRELTNSSINNLVNSIINIEDSPLKKFPDDIIDLGSTSYSSFLPEREVNTNDDSVIILDNSGCADMDVRNTNNLKSILKKHNITSRIKKKVSYANGSATNTRHSNKQPDDLEIVKVYRISDKNRIKTKLESLKADVRRLKLLETTRFKPLNLQHIANITHSTPKKTATNSKGTNEENHTRVEENTTNKDSDRPPEQPAKSIGDCPVCLESLSNKEIMSTTCGHLFCMPCIVSVIRKKKCCPICRTKLSLKSIHPIYI